MKAIREAVKELKCSYQTIVKTRFAQHGGGVIPVAQGHYVGTFFELLCQLQVLYVGAEINKQLLRRYAVLQALVMAHPRCTQLVKQELLQERVTKGKIDIWSLEVRD